MIRKDIFKDKLTLFRLSLHLYFKKRIVVNYAGSPGQLAFEVFELQFEFHHSTLFPVVLCNDLNVSLILKIDTTTA